MAGGSRAKYSDVELVYIQNKALRRMIHTTYIFPATLREIFIFFFKSRNDIHAVPDREVDQNQPTYQLNHVGSPLKRDLINDYFILVKKGYNASKFLPLKKRKKSNQLN